MVCTLTRFYIKSLKCSDSINSLARPRLPDLPQSKWTERRARTLCVYSGKPLFAYHRPSRGSPNVEPPIGYSRPSHELRALKCSNISSSTRNPGRLRNKIPCDPRVDATHPYASRGVTSRCLAPRTRALYTMKTPAISSRYPARGSFDGSLNLTLFPREARGIRPAPERRRASKDLVTWLAPPPEIACGRGNDAGARDRRSTGRSNRVFLQRRGCFRSFLRQFGLDSPLARKLRRFIAILLMCNVRSVQFNSSTPPRTAPC